VRHQIVTVALLLATSGAASFVVVHPEPLAAFQSIGAPPPAVAPAPEPPETEADFARRYAGEPLWTDAPDLMPVASGLAILENQPPEASGEPIATPLPGRPSLKPLVGRRAASKVAARQTPASAKGRRLRSASAPKARATLAANKRPGPRTAQGRRQRPSTASPASTGSTGAAPEPVEVAPESARVETATRLNAIVNPN
jgi:hypothetical protein